MVKLGGSWHEQLALLVAHFSLSILAYPFQGHYVSMNITHRIHNNNGYNDNICNHDTIYIYMHIYICICICVCIYIYIYIYTYKHKANTYSGRRTNSTSCPSRPRARRSMAASLARPGSAQAFHTYIQTYTHTYIHTNIHTYIHTYSLLGSISLNYTLYSLVRPETSRRFLCFYLLFKHFPSVRHRWCCANTETMKQQHTEHIIITFPATTETHNAKEGRRP